MTKFLGIFLCLLASATLAKENTLPPDDLIPLEELEEVVVTGVRGDLEIYVFIDEAKICFIPRGWEATHCFNALVGKNTPRGEFSLKRYRTPIAAYGGDILVFKENEKSVWAIHRVISVPGQNRLKRIQSDKAKHRTVVTHGCINVMPDVYELIVDCCSNSKIKITTMRTPGG